MTGNSQSPGWWSFPEKAEVALLLFDDDSICPKERI
jgi:hypothetical protein